MGKGSSPPPPTSQTVNQTNLPAWAQPYSEKMLGQAEALTDTTQNPYKPYTGQRVADFTPMQQQAFQGIQGMQPNAATGAGIDVAANAARQASQYGNYQPQQFGNQYQGQNFNNMGLGYLATQNPNLQNFQMGGPQDVRGVRTQAAQLDAAPTYGGTQFQGPRNVRGAQTQAAQLNAAPAYGGTQFQGPQDVGAERVGTQNFNNPATAQSYMNPYMQNVVDTQQREAQRTADIAATGRNAQASRAGAFGGSRQAIENAEAARNLATQKGDIQAQGLSTAYNQAQQAFQTDQARQLQAQQANQQTGLQADMSNQQMGYNTNLQNAQLGQQAGLATQGLMGQYGLQQGQFGQAANLANQQTRQQADLANQQMGYNTNLQNAQLRQQTGLSNQQMAGQYGLQQGQFGQAANLANQQTQQQANLANQQMGYNVGNTNLQSRLGVQQLGSGQNMQSQLANQGAYGQMQGLGMQQNLAGNQQAMQNAQLGAQYGLAGQQAGEQSRQFGSNLGLQGLQQQLAAAGQLGQLGQQQYGQQMGIASAQQQAGAQQQAMNQQNLTNTYQDYLTRQNYPYQQLGYMSDILHGTPTGGVTTQQSYQANPSMANQIMGYGLGAYGLSNLMKKEGGVIKGYKAGGVVKHFVEGGITGLPGAMSPEAQYQLALKMGVGPLQGILNGKPSQITPLVAGIALKQLQSAQVAANGMQAQQELAKNPGTVLDRMKTQQQPSPLPEDQGGIAALNTDNMNDVVQAAEGGIIGYADGGDVKHFQNAGSVPFQPVLPFSLRRGSEVEKQRAAQARANEMAMNTGAPLPFPPTNSEWDTPVAGAAARLQGEIEPVNSLSEPSPAATPAATPPPRNNAPRAAPVPQGLESLNANPDALARMQANIDASKAAAPAPAEQGIAAVAREEAGPPAPKQASGLGYLDAMNARRQVGFDSIAEAVKQLGMPKAMADSDKGALMLEAASSFLTSRTFAEGAGGAGKIIAAKVTALNKTNDEAKRAMLQSQISMETAKMGMEQGDAKMAVDLLNHSSEMAHKEKALKIQEGHWTKQDEAEFVKNEILREKERNAAMVGVAQAESLRANASESPSRINYYNAQASRDPDRAAELRAASAERTAGIAALTAVVKGDPFGPQGKEARRLLMQLGLGNGKATAPPSIQRPETGINPKDILD